MKNTDNPSSADMLDHILGRTPANYAKNTVMENMAKEEELKTHQKAENREKRRQRSGISFAWALILLILTNMAWMGYIKYIDAPRWQATVEEYRTALEEKDETIRRIQVIYAEREKDFEKRLVKAEQDYEGLNKRLQRAIDAYNKYFGRDDPVE